MKLPPLLLLLLVLPVRAQIYADFTVSQGGSPLGTFRVLLEHEKAPRTCANFIGLATGQREWLDLTTGQFKAGVRYYDGLTFHRLDHAFVIQGGSPNGQGTDGPGYSILDEFHPDLRHSGRYILSMAKSDEPDTGGSQFFITLEAAALLDDRHSVFGEVITGKGIIDDFTNSTLFPTDVSERPLTPITMDSVVISGPDLAGFNIHDPALHLPVARSMPATSIARDEAASRAVLTFDRIARTRYTIFSSTDLNTWSLLGGLTSINAEAADVININGVSSDQYFVRSAPFDYGHLPIVDGNLVANGKVLALSDRSGNSLTLSFDGAGGGTWLDSSGGSGAITGVNYFQVMVSGLSGNGPNRLSWGVLRANFDAPAGVAGWSTVDLIFSFHENNSGQCFYNSIPDKFPVSDLPVFSIAP